MCEQKKNRNIRKGDNHTELYKTYTRNAYWKRLSNYVRQRDLCMCQICGRIASEVHHIIKVEDEPEKAYDETNLISLCHACHLRAEKGFIEKQVLFDKAKESIEKYNERMGC